MFYDAFMSATHTYKAFWLFCVVIWERFSIRIWYVALIMIQIGRFAYLNSHMIYEGKYIYSSHYENGMLWKRRIHKHSADPADWVVMDSF